MTCHVKRLPQCHLRRFPLANYRFAESISSCSDRSVTPDKFVWIPYAIDHEGIAFNGVGFWAVVTIMLVKTMSTTTSLIPATLAAILAVSMTLTSELVIILVV
jgi:hypothetical protein|tara:strand:- start:1661 stop:1969 length:309 start_codon:yes stop_codon:yes gene_type:complete